MKIMVSACLLGEPVRYDGEAQRVTSSVLQEWQRQGLIVGYCPEIAGSLPTPRPAAECQVDGSVRTGSGDDVTAAFRRGAEATLALCQRHGVRCALLKERSPSCGSRQIYSGHFDGTLQAGEGMTAALLRQHGIQLFSELELPDFIAYVQALLAQQPESCSR
jgi:uncharacterized protein YbbK (DUF523 family)